MAQLRDVAEISMGQSPKGDRCFEFEKGLPLLNGPTEFGSRHPTPTQWTDDPKRFAEIGDLLFCVRGSTTGRMNWANQEYAIGRGLAAIRHKSGPEYQPWLRGVIELQLPELLTAATGSTFPNVSKDQLHDLWVPDQPLPEQREIAGILGALDDKIELNRRMAATLEEMARSLYRSWFVDFDPVHAKTAGQPPAHMDKTTAALFPDRFGDDGLPEGWRMGCIYEIAKVQYGAPFKSNLFNTNQNGRPLVRIRDLKNHQAGVYTTEVHPKEYVIQPGDTVVGMDGDFTPYTWCAEPSLMNQRVCCFMPVAKINHAFLRFSIPALLKAEEEAAVATTVIHLGKKDIDTFKVVLPSDAILHLFGERVNPLISKMVSVGLEAKTLATLRDSLLPRLMSGDLRVGAAREQIGEYM
jgi:type I restriction enzyme, S subunit